MTQIEEIYLKSQFSRCCSIAGAFRSLMLYACACCRAKVYTEATITECLNYVRQIITHERRIGW